MKKLLSLITIAAMFSFVACGPSQEEKDKAAKVVQDSIAKVALDSTNAANAMAAAQKATADSLAAAQKMTADSLAAAQAKMSAKPKGKGKKK